MLINVSFSIRPYKSKPLKNGKLPIVICTQWRDGGRDHTRRKRLGVACYPEEFDHEYNRIKSGVWGARKRNEVIENAEMKARKVHRTYFKDRPWNYKKWVEYFEQKGDTITLNVFTEELIELFHKMNRSGTATYYENTLKALQKFLRKKRIYFSDINKSVLKDLEKNYIKRGFKGDRMMRGVKTIYSKAVEEEIIDVKDMPFKTAYNPVGYKFTHLKKIKRNSSLIERLSVQQLIDLFNYEPLNEGEEKAMDLWKFSYYTMGVNLKDLALMKESNIHNFFWHYSRSKTNNASGGKPLLPEAIAIIDKYKHSDNTFIFDFILNGVDSTDSKRVQERIRDTCSNLRRRYMKISKRLEFDGHFTFYSARYTSATISANRGANMRAVQANLDHSSLRTTEIYTRFRDEDAVRESLELLRVS